MVSDFIKTHNDVLEMQTGAPGYNEYWSKKQEKVNARYEAMKEFLGAKEAANGAL